MKGKSLFLLYFAFFLAACSTDDNAPSLSIPEKDSERVEMELSVESASSPFYYLIQAKELIIDWGDGTKPEEYVFLEDINDLSKLKPIKRNYNSAGKYRIKMSSYRPFAFNFSRGIEGESVKNEISDLKFINCWNLQRLYCKNQPLLKSLDIKSCENLKTLDISGSAVNLLDINKENSLDTLIINNTSIETFDCTYVGNIQYLAIGSEIDPDIKNIQSLSRLKALAIEGNIQESNLSLTQNDSLQSISLTKANIVTINLSKLRFLTSILVGNCSNLSTVRISDNPQLKDLHLVNNPSLTAQRLNTLFSELPSAGDVSRTITLQGNAGDDTCDRSIATRKGWTFR